MSNANIECVKSYFDGHKISIVQRKFLVIAAAAYFFDQMDVILFGLVAPVIKEQWSLSLDQIALMSSLSFWGMCIGGISGGVIANYIGRKKGLLFCIGIFSIAQIINGLTSSVLIFYCMRFLVGFGVIGMVVIAMVYIAEMMPSENRGKYQSIAVAVGVTGIPISAILATVLIPLTPHSWRIVFVLGGGEHFPLTTRTEMVTGIPQMAG